MITSRKFFGAGAIMTMVVGLIVGGSISASAAVQPDKVESCRDNNFVRLFAAGPTTCYADDGTNNISIANPTSVDGGNNDGHVVQSGNKITYFLGGGGTVKLTGGSATAVQLVIVSQL